MPDEVFTVYHKGSLEKRLNSFLVGARLPEGMKSGDKFFFPVDGGGIGTAELVKTGQQNKED